MRWKNDAERYGRVAMAFHWLMAVIIIGMILVGLIMGDMENSPDKFRVYGLHKSTGILILGLVLLRISWRFANRQPDDVPAPKLQQIAAKLVHGFLYVTMIGMPLSGWLMSSASGYPVSFYGLFVLPNLVEPDKEFAHLMHELHEMWAFVLIAAIAIHLLAALKHHFVDKDMTLKRMLP